RPEFALPIQKYNVNRSRSMLGSMVVFYYSKMMVNWDLSLTFMEKNT
ncbi:unnamed protein product, partial [marine sediment metagenome]